jgi:hypothetical protein
MDALTRYSFNTNYDPVLVIIYLRRIPRGRTQKDIFFKALAASLDPLSTFHLGTTEQGNFHNCRSEKNLFTSEITNFQKKFIVMCNYNTNLLTNTPNPKDNLDFWTNARIYLDENGKKRERTFVVDTDEGVRADTSLEGLSSLKPAFAINGSVTAGNSSQISDGAAFVVVMSEAMVKELGLQPLGQLVHCAVAGVNPRLMGIGPVEVIPKLLKGVNMRLEDIDLIELNEAFAAQAIAVVNTLGLDSAKVNINGGAIALGHPLGCTGAKLSVQILGDLKRLNKKYGMVSACVGGGQGIAGLIERF